MTVKFKNAEDSDAVFFIKNRTTGQTFNKYVKSGQTVNLNGSHKGFEIISAECPPKSGWETLNEYIDDGSIAGFSYCLYDGSDGQIQDGGYEVYVVGDC